MKYHKITKKLFNVNPFKLPKLYPYKIKKFGYYPIFKSFLKDSDKDGMPDILDCRPFNSRKQGVRPNTLMRQRIERLPIYITKHSPSRTNITQRSNVDYYHISSSKADPEVKQRVYSTFKKYPHLVGEVERTKPRGLYYSKEILERGKQAKRIKGFQEEDYAVVKTSDIPKQGLEGIRQTAMATSHELKHVRQERHTPTKKLRGLFKGEYFFRKGEVSAREQGAETYYKRPDINIKIAERQIESGKEKVTRVEPTTYERQKYSKEQVQESIQKHKEQVEQKSSEGLKQLTKDEEEEQ